MTTYLGWAVAVLILVSWWWWSRRDSRNWRHLAQLLADLADGKPVAGFVFRHGGRFAQLTHVMEKLADEQERLRQQMNSDSFNLRTILASMEEGVIVVDAQQTLRVVNPSFLRLFDLKADPVGQTVLRTLREAAFAEVVSAALKTGEAQTEEIATTTSKQTRHFAVHAVPIRERPEEAGVVVIVRDVSRLRRLEEVRREFVANVSHELRTPLSIFHGYLENLIDTPSMPRKEQAEVYEVLRKHSLRLNALLEDLLTLARLESRHEKLDLRELNLAEVMKSVAGDWAAKLRQKKLTLNIDTPPDLPTVRADRLRLEQVLHNLLENAVKYTEVAGTITLRAISDASSVTLRIEDTGTGIPPSDLPHIFERFYRADKARTREHGGTGLGLSIVKHIVHLHGGTVSAESKYGSGTAIILRLPMAA